MTGTAAFAAAPVFHLPGDYSIMSQSSSSALSLEVRPDGIGVMTFDQPGSRANTLGQAVVGELEGIVTHLQSRKDLKGLILHSGKPGMFIAGADLKELGGAKPDSEQTRRTVKRGLEVIAAVEALPYPTVAAIDGACMGGGLELAMGFDFRLASTNPKTELGLPEVKIGLFPGWGGTQRLSRLIGPALAAELICAGEAVKPDRARAMGLIFDAVLPEKLLDEAVRLLHWAAQSESVWREARKKKQQPVGLSEDQLSFIAAVTRAQVLEKTKGQYPAPLAALGAIVKGCNLPLEAGLKIETDGFVPLVGSLTSVNLIAVFFMSQRLQKDPGVTDASVQPRPVQRVGVLGAGIMGAGIAGAHIRRGVPVTLLDSSPQALEKGVAGLAKNMQGRVEIGRMAPADLVASLARLSTTATLHALADRDVVIEAVIENEATKVQVYQELQNILPADAILATNTSTISITRMAKSVNRPENFAGMHFFNPVERMQLVEVIRGEKSSDATVATLVALAKRIGKTPIVVRDCPGFLVNRILFPYMNEALTMVEEGAEPRAIDKAATAFGMPMGPITLHDVVGIDTAFYAGKVIFAAFPDRATAPRIVAELVAARRLGQKSGAGFYSYAKGPRGTDDPAFAAVLDKCRSGRRTFTQEEITDRLFLPMLAEASRVLTEGIVREPADVDMGLILGIGFPPFQGGLLRWADGVGMAKVLERLKRYESLGARFLPTEPMRQMAKTGKGFYHA
jgi:3-hydroxyacyl-CoA dehydrogenase/enoyl-CoA hydratase/3-hydroxybutyryl-CoA epimerase/3-hydroxyacyl-CoA dehydrogenase/enoyl-CoA hydratase/3-hydroxybutyryl-CoA epimerase/enoyl-CoA isomerase